MKIRFIKTYTVKAVDGETYEEGKTYEMGDASCRHFVNKQVAVAVTGASMPKPESVSGSNRPASKRG